MQMPTIVYIINYDHEQLITLNNRLDTNDRSFII